MGNNVKKLKNIVVATDFSETSDFAISRAVAIAKATRANLTILHVLQKSLFDKTLEAIIPDEILQSPEEYITTLIKEKILALSRHKLNIDLNIISQGKAAVKILQYAKKNKIDLLVIGAHGKYSIRDSFVGTTAEHIAKRTKCPVLIVKNPPTKSFNKILVPIDFSVVSKRALNYTIQLFPDSHIRLIHVGDFEYENLLKKEEKEGEISKAKIAQVGKAIILFLDIKMKKYIKGFRSKLGKYSYQIALGYPGPVIVKEASKLRQDLIVMGTQGYGRRHYLFIGSVANWVLTETDKDILLIPPKTKK